MKKCIVLLLALSAFLQLFAAYAPVRASAAGGTPIPGIDYGRITTRANGGEKSYRVEMKCGQVTFEGELYGDFGLSYDEMNIIINDVLAEKGLTVAEVRKVASLAANVQNKATKYWGNQVLTGIFSFAQLPGIPVSLGDFYDWLIYRNVKDEAPSVTIASGQEAAKRIITKAAEGSGRVGRVAKTAVSEAKSIPLLGQIANTALVAVDWKSGNQRFDNYLKLLEERMALINDFYSECSRRALKIAETKGEYNKWKIRFDGRKNYKTYNCTFWDVPGNVMSVKLSGELVKASGSDVTGVYEGPLWVELEAVDFSALESNIEKTTGPRLFFNTLYSIGGYRKITDSGKKTVLRRELQSDVIIMIESSYGDGLAEFAGSLTGGQDETTFSFSRHVVWRDDTAAALRAVGVTDVTFTSQSVSSISLESSSRVEKDGAVVDERRANETFTQNPGTVFDPVKLSPSVRVIFGK